MADKKDDAQSAQVEIYTPPNKLAEAIGKGNGPTLREMQREADKRMQALSEDYQSFFLKTLGQMKLSVKNSATFDDALASIYANAHDIKGQATIFGYPLVADVANCLCIAINSAPEKLAQNHELLDLHLNALQWAYDHQNDEEKQTEKELLVQSLQNAISSA